MASKKKRVTPTRARDVQREVGRERRVGDPQLQEFETADLGEDIRDSGVARVIHRRRLPTSILLDDDLVAELRKKAAKRGIGYQTMLKIIVREHLGEY